MTYSEFVRKYDGDHTWHWFLRNRWCGTGFTWHRKTPTISSDYEFLRNEIMLMQAVDRDFVNKARAVALEVIESEDLYLRCASCQVLAIVGRPEDMDIIRKIGETSVEEASRNARTSIFILRKGANVGDATENTQQ